MVMGDVVVPGGDIGNRTRGLGVRAHEHQHPALLEEAVYSLMEWLDQPLPQADAQLAQMHERYTAARLAALAIDSVSAPDVRQWLRLQPAFR